MGSLPQLRRDLREVESQLRFTRNRLRGYETRTDAELAAHTSRVVAGLEETKQALAARIQQLTHDKT